jgi:hypothetical protein
MEIGRLGKLRAAIERVLITAIFCFSNGSALSAGHHDRPSRIAGRGHFYQAVVGAFSSGEFDEEKVSIGKGSNRRRRKHDISGQPRHDCNPSFGKPGIGPHKSGVVNRSQQPLRSLSMD